MYALSVLASMFFFSVLLILDVSFRLGKNAEAEGKDGTADAARSKQLEMGTTLVVPPKDHLEVVNENPTAEVGSDATATTNGLQIAIVAEKGRLDNSHGAHPAYSSQENQSFAMARSLNMLAEDSSLPRYRVDNDTKLDMVSLLHNIQCETPQLMNGDVSTFEVQESVSGNVANMDHTLFSQTAAPIQRHVQVVEMKTQFKVACWVLPVSAGGIISVLAGLFGNERASLRHKVLFKAYTVCIYASSISCLSVVLMYFLRAYVKPTICIVNLFMWAALGTVAYALAFATCMMFPMGLTGMVLLLVSPFFPVGIVLLIRISNR